MSFTHSDFPMSRETVAGRLQDGGWLARFASEKRRWAIITPVAAAIIVVVAAAGNKGMLGLAWYAIILAAKALELALAMRVQSGPESRGPRIGLVAAEIVLCLGWGAAFLLFRDQGVTFADLTTALVVAMMAALQAASIMRSRPSVTAEPEPRPVSAPLRPSVSLGDLAEDLLKRTRHECEARSLSPKLVIEAHLPDLVGDRHRLQALVDAIGLPLIRCQNPGSRLEITATMTGADGLRLAFAAAAVTVRVAADLARAESMARELGAVMSLRHAADRSTIITLDFPASQTVLTTPVEHRPLADPTAGQRLLIALTQ